MRQLDLFGMFEEEVKPAKKLEELLILEEKPVEYQPAAEHGNHILNVSAADAEPEIVDRSFEVVVQELPLNEVVIIAEVDTIAEVAAEEQNIDYTQQTNGIAVDGDFEERKPSEQIVTEIQLPPIAEAREEDDDVIDFTRSITEKKLQPAVAMITKVMPVKIPGRRGRKSFKEIDAGIALVEVPDDDTLFQKMYYPISLVAKWFNVNASLLRFWENEFDVLQPRKNRKGDRLFRPEDVKTLQVIYFLLRQRKFSIEGAKRYLKQNKNKAEVNVLLIQSLTKMRSFFLELRANLGE